MRRVLVLLVAAGFAAGCGGTSESLPYSKVVFTASDAEKAFASEGVDVKPKSDGPAGTTLGDTRDILEVDVFGDPAVVRRTGFQDLQHGADCSVAGHLALHWRENVRVVLNCQLVANRRAWIAKMDDALTALR